jgi:hypothetical protein
MTDSSENSVTQRSDEATEKTVRKKRKPSSSTGVVPSNWAQKWTDEEDKRLLMGIEQYGENNWRLVSQIVGTRDAGGTA